MDRLSGRCPPVTAKRLVGRPGSPGRATGAARIVRGPDEFAAVRPGDVLVCRISDPAWTPLFGVISAVVTEVGGVLSHAAIVAREVGIPTVLAVPGATTELTNDTLVTVDGTTGHVLVHRS
ncbi:MAG: PEP-utilizing enzyme [Austwickia sp.]|nr:PEP-utilizing enzyme [Austwickia sp.]